MTAFRDSFPDTMSENFCPPVTVQRKKESRPFPFSDISSALFYRIGACIWLRFTSLLAADIVKRDQKDLNDEKRTNVFIVDDSLFGRSSCRKTELSSRVFDHTYDALTAHTAISA